MADDDETKRMHNDTMTDDLQHRIIEAVEAGARTTRALRAVVPGRDSRIGELVNDLVEAGRLERDASGLRVVGAPDTEPAPAPEPSGIDVDVPPPVDDLDDLIASRLRAFDRKNAHEESAALVAVRVADTGPIGILHFGDPHVDDDGTDLRTLLAHADLVRRTPCLYAGNVGDSTNNWVGRLARLYAQQATTSRQAWMLAEHFIQRVGRKWLYIVGGNHDCWSGDGDPLHWITSRAGASYHETNVRLELQWRTGAKVRVNIRHDFAGSSQWNPAHGSMKAAQMGARDHLLVNGHRHVSGIGQLKDPSSGLVSTCIQVASYKVFDRYAKERGFRDQHISPCAVTVIDPDAAERGEWESVIQTFWRAERGAEYLTMLRRSRGLADANGSARHWGKP